jgi:hypothetical protein
MTQAATNSGTVADIYDIAADNDATATANMRVVTPPIGSSFLLLSHLWNATSFTSAAIVRVMGLLPGWNSEPEKMEIHKHPEALARLQPDMTSAGAIEGNGFWYPLCNLNIGDFAITLPSDSVARWTPSILTKPYLVHTLGASKIALIVSTGAVLNTPVDTNPIIGVFGK